jgi:predicted lipid-binding transport protein (Tim44 family)
MSPYLIFEFLIYTGVVLFLFFRLFNVVGTTSEDDPARNNANMADDESLIKNVSEGYNGESISPAGDLTNNNYSTRFKFKATENETELAQSESEFSSNLQKLQTMFKNFEPNKFLRGAKNAFPTIIDAANNAEDNQLDQLVDKRFKDEIKSISKDYGEILNSQELEAKLSEIYVFGRNATLRVLFESKNGFSGKRPLKESWTFIKNSQDTSPNWYLTSIEEE